MGAANESQKNEATLVWEDVLSLKFNQSYQRGIELNRLRSIMRSMERDGFWPTKPVVINLDREIVDGQHRVESARRLGIKTVPCIMAIFETKQKEAEYFVTDAMHNTTLAPVPFWHSRYLAENDLAKFIYLLEADQESLLCGRIAIKGRATKKSKFTIPHALLILSVSQGTNQTWNTQVDHKFNQIVTRNPYVKLRNEINTVVRFFFDCFGVDKMSNPIPFYGKSQRAIWTLYLALNRQGFFVGSKYRRSVAKIRTIYLDAAFTRMDQIGMTTYLFSSFNVGKQHKLKYENFAVSQNLDD